MINETRTLEKFGYNSSDLSTSSHKSVWVICTECLTERLISMGNYNKLKYPDMCLGCSTKKTHRKERDPLPNGWTSKLSDITDNKESATYLGSVAETILSRIYDDVQVMPINNPGFDFICSKDYKIDVKSSATGDKLGYWMFRINKNQIADYFLCLAFNNRYDLYNPVHLWLIPNNVINHLSCTSISKSTLNKWRKYELSLDKVISCCDSLR